MCVCGCGVGVCGVIWCGVCGVLCGMCVWVCAVWCFVVCVWVCGCVCVCASGNLVIKRNFTYCAAKLS